MPSYTLSNWDGSLTQKQEAEQSKRSVNGDASLPMHIARPESETVNVGDKLEETYGSFAMNVRSNGRGGQSFGPESSSCDTYAFDKQQPSVSREITSVTEIFDFGVSVTHASPGAKRMLSTDAYRDIAYEMSSMISVPAGVNNAPFVVNNARSPVVSFRTPLNPPKELKTSGGGTIDAVDRISMHSYDAEGEEVDDEEDIVVVHDMLKSLGSSTPCVALPRASTSRHISFSPPLGPADGLFTPPPDQTRKKSNSFLAYVQVPPLRKGLRKEDYKPFFRPLPSQPHHPVQIHRNISDALAASWKNNEGANVQKKRKKKSSVMKAFAGPSQIHHESVSTAMIGTKQTKKRKHQGSDAEDIDKKKSRTKVYPLLSKSNISVSASQALRKVPLPSQKAKRVETIDRDFDAYGSTRYNHSKDEVRMVFNRIKSVPPPVTVMNTRYLRVNSSSAVLSDDGVNGKGKGEARDEIDDAGAWFKWPPSTSSSTADDDDIISAGGTIGQNWEGAELASVEVEGYLELEPALQPPKTPLKTPLKTTLKKAEVHAPLPRIDLAEQLLKKKGLERKQRQPDAGKRTATAVSMDGESSSVPAVITTAETLSRSESVTLPNVPPESFAVAAGQTNNSNSVVSDLISMPLSSKALGKLRAITPVRLIAGLSQHHINGVAIDLFLQTHSSPTGQPRHSPSSSSQFKVYRNPLASKVLLSSLDPSSYFHDSGVGDDILYGRGGGNEGASSFLANPSAVPFNVDLENLQEYSRDPWATLDQGDYRYHTINPTLLHGGQDLELTNSMADFEDDWNEVDTDPVLQQDSPVVTRSRSQSTSTSSSVSLPLASTSSSRPLQESESMPLPMGGPVSEKSDDLPARRRPVQRRFYDDMIPVEHLDLSPRSSTLESEYQASGLRKAKTRRLKDPVTTKGSQASKPESTPAATATSATKRVVRRGYDNWARGDEECYCHQCRSKSDKLKMRCRGCVLKYCNRCIANRYPEVVFAPKFANLCPCCDQTCNCDVCCRKRGEVFVSQKGKPRVNAKMVVGDKKPPKRVQKDNVKAPVVELPPPTNIISGPVTYWGHVYSLTGERMATGFVDPAGDESVVLARRIGGPEFTRKKVFVGAVQSSWGLGSNLNVFDCDPMPAQKRGGVKSRGKKRRMYVGNESLLYLPCSRGKEQEQVWGGEDDPGAIFASSPLSSLTDSDSEDDGGSGNKSFSSDSLEENDIARAIALSLNACGLSVESEEHATDG